MRRRSRAGGERVKSQRHKAVTLKRRSAPESGGARGSVAGKETDVARLTRELSEALEQQTATSEVLQVISSSPGNLEPVFEALLANAQRLCGAKFGTLLLREGDAFRTMAMHGATSEYTEARQRTLLIQPAGDTGLGRVLKAKKVVQIADIQEVPGYAANPVQAPDCSARRCTHDAERPDVKGAGA